MKTRSVPNPKCKHGFEVSYTYSKKEDGGLTFPLTILWVTHDFDGKSCGLYKSGPRVRPGKRAPRTTYQGTLDFVARKLAHDKD